MPAGRRAVIGQTLGHYKVESQLGSGGTGAVYLAYDATLHRRVALKVLTGHLAEDTHATLLHEARAASALNHPNICTIYEVGQAEGLPFIVMEYVEGKRLAEVIPERGLPVDSALRYAVQLAGALAHAHERGVVHRDLKSANVVVTDPGHVKILDFGLARMLTPEPRPEDRNAPTLSATGSQVGIVGTLAYMAPEVLCGHAADVRGDIWSLGVVLYEMATGHLPFEGHGTFELSAAILREPPAPFTRPLPASLRGLILRCLAKEPGQRYQRATEVAAALEAIHSDVVTGPVGTVAPPARTRVRLLAAVLAAAVLLGIVVFVGLRQRAAPSFARSIASGQLQRLTMSEMQLQEPAVSPDGKVIAYVGETAGQFDLFVMRVSGGEPVRLTSDAQPESTPRFSPDGETIVFTRRNVATGLSEVSLIPTFGGEVATVMRRAGDATWSPDATQLAVVRRRYKDEPMALMTMRRDGSDASVLLQGDGTYPFLRTPSWSPDGSTIAIVRSTGGLAGEIWLIGRGGTPPRKLTNEPTAIFSDAPCFTPDGRGLVHVSNRGGADNLWYLPLDGSAPTRITSGPGPDESPSVASDGRVVFVNARWRHVLLLHQLEGSTTRTLLTDSSILWGPAFSPDGQELAFSRTETGGGWHVWTIRLDGSRARRVTASDAGEIYPRYTPDGQWLVFHSWKMPHVVSRVRRTGGEANTITTSPDTGDGFADVSPDGKRIVFARALAHGERIFTAPASGGPARQLTETPGSVPRWSPDGRFVAFSGDRTYAGGVFVIGADGRGERRLSATGGWQVWWPDGQRLGYLVIGESGDQEIEVVATAGGAPTRVRGLRFSGSNNPFDVSPDGALLATSNSVHVSSELWRLDPAR